MNNHLTIAQIEESALRLRNMLSESEREEMRARADEYEKIFFAELKKEGIVRPKKEKIFCKNREGK